MGMSTRGRTSSDLPPPAASAGRAPASGASSSGTGAASGRGAPLSSKNWTVRPVVKKRDSLPATRIPEHEAGPPRAVVHECVGRRAPRPRGPHRRKAVPARGWRGADARDKDAVAPSLGRQRGRAQEETRGVRQLQSDGARSAEAGVRGGVSRAGGRARLVFAERVHGGVGPARNASDAQSHGCVFRQVRRGQDGTHAGGPVRDGGAGEQEQDHRHGGAPGGRVRGWRRARLRV